MSESRNNNFDVLRLVAATAVVFSHSFPVTQGDASREPLTLLSHNQATIGHVSVLIFFVVSGYLITQSWDRTPNIWRFLRSRLLRIFPALLAIALLCAFILGPLVTVFPIGKYFTSSMPYMYVVNTLALYPFLSKLPGVFSTTPYGAEVNAPLWTLRFEFTFYLMVMILGVARLLNVWVIACLMVLSIFLLAGAQNADPRLAAGLDLFKHFGAGMILYLLRDRLPMRVWLAGLSGVILIATLFIGTFNTAFSVFGAYLIFWFAFARNVRHVPAARFGDLSYGIYIFAWPIQQVLILLFPRMIWWENTALALFFTIPIAYMSWHMIEKRALRWKSRKQVFSGSDSGESFTNSVIRP